MRYLLKYQGCNVFEVKSVTEKSHKQTLVSSSITLSYLLFDSQAKRENRNSFVYLNTKYLSYVLL